MATMRGRKIGWWHLWLGVALLIPLLWWVGTAVVFALWPIETVRGKALSTGNPVPTVPLGPDALPTSEMVIGAQAVTLRTVEGNPVAIIQRGGSPEVWDLKTKSRLGPMIPLPWARASAERDFHGDFKATEVHLYDSHGRGRRLEPTAGPRSELPSEYAGPLPVYAFHLGTGPNMHLYVDALTGEVRARRTSIWRFYDLCFRLHSLEFTPDLAKRVLILAVGGCWIALGGTGLVMASRIWKRKARHKVRPPNSPL